MTKSTTFSLIGFILGLLLYHGTCGADVGLTLTETIVDDFPVWLVGALIFAFMGFVVGHIVDSKKK
tara:strand:+ start:2333 stop:2530 length:198 start_codon:yes stop_codon:yes gene_type:complete